MDKNDFDIDFDFDKEYGLDEDDLSGQAGDEPQDQEPHPQGGPHGSEGPYAHALPHDDGVGHVVDLLEKAAEDHRHCKNRQRFQRRIGNQILIF